MRPRRHPVRYTLWLARTGAAPKSFSLPVWVPVAVLLVLACWSGLNVYLWNRTAEMRSLEIRLISLSDQARKLNNQLGEERTRNNALTDSAQNILRQLQTLETEINTLRERAGMPKIKLTPARNEPSSQAPGQREGTGGGTGRASLEQIMAYAEGELKTLGGDLGAVSPALNETLEREEATPFGFPVRGHARVASNFGYRGNPFGWGFEFHNGLDFPAPYGTPVRVTGAGVVEAAGFRPVFGLAVVVDHGFGYKTLYGHLSSVSVRAGQAVERGEVLGQIGSTGRSTGPHLHYTVFRSGEAVNPRAYLQ